MATLSSTLTLDNLDGIDPVNINIAPSFSVTEPSGSGAFATAPGLVTPMLSWGGSSDYIVLVVNRGLPSGNKHGKVLLRSGQGDDIALLTYNDFAFIPLKAGVGLEATYDLSETSVEWFYWSRP